MLSDLAFSSFEMSISTLMRGSFCAGGPGAGEEDAHPIFAGCRAASSTAQDPSYKRTE